MIKFEGEISEETRRNILKRRSYAAGRLILYIVAFFVSIGIILWLFDLKEYAKMFLIYIFLIPLAILICFFPTPTKKFPWNHEITITATEIIDKHILSERDIRTKIKSINKIKKVIDFGNFYCLIYADISNCIVCEKNLITEGSEEEFEKIFDKKIKRKY